MDIKLDAQLEIGIWRNGKVLTPTGLNYAVTVQRDSESSIRLQSTEHPAYGYYVEIIWGTPISDWHACRMSLRFIDGSYIGHWLPTLIYLGTCPIPMTTTFICGWPTSEAQGPWTVATRRANMIYTPTEFGSPMPNLTQED